MLAFFIDDVRGGGVVTFGSFQALWVAYFSEVDLEKCGLFVVGKECCDFIFCGGYHYMFGD